MNLQHLRLHAWNPRKIKIIKIPKWIWGGAHKTLCTPTEGQLAAKGCWETDVSVFLRSLAPLQWLAFYPCFSTNSTQRLKKEVYEAGRKIWWEGLRGRCEKMLWSSHLSQINKYILWKNNTGAREMSQGLEPPFVLLEDPSLVPGTHIRWLTLWVPTYIVRVWAHTHTQIKIQSKKL